jgi:hypothetical protein
MGWAVRVAGAVSATRLRDEAHIHLRVTGMSNEQAEAREVDGQSRHN